MKFKLNQRVVETSFKTPQRGVITDVSHCLNDVSIPYYIVTFDDKSYGWMGSANTRNTLIPEVEYDDKTEQKLATLTQEEDNEWVALFSYYIDKKYSQKKADKYALEDLQEQFPRLKEFDGCKP